MHCNHHCKQHWPWMWRMWAETICAAEGTVDAAEAAAMAVAQTLKKLQDADALGEAQREEARMLQLQRDMIQAAEEQRRIMEAREQEQAIMQEALREQQRVMQLMRRRGSLGLSHTFATSDAIPCLSAAPLLASHTWCERRKGC